MYSHLTPYPRKPATGPSPARRWCTRASWRHQEVTGMRRRAWCRGPQCKVHVPGRRQGRSSRVALTRVCITHPPVCAPGQVAALAVPLGTAKAQLQAGPRQPAQLLNGAFPGRRGAHVEALALQAGQAEHRHAGQPPGQPDELTGVGRGSELHAQLSHQHLPLRVIGSRPSWPALSDNYSFASSLSSCGVTGHEGRSCTVRSWTR